MSILKDPDITTVLVNTASAETIEVRFGEKQGSVTVAALLLVLVVAIIHLVTRKLPPRISIY